MYGTENELVIFAIKMRLNTFFSLLTSLFAVLALLHHLQCMERHMKAGGLFHLGWFWRTGQSGSRARFFQYRQYRRGKHGAWTRATADAGHSRREPQHWQKEGGAAFLQ